MIAECDLKLSAEERTTGWGRFLVWSRRPRHFATSGYNYDAGPLLQSEHSIETVEQTVYGWLDRYAT